MTARPATLEPVSAAFFGAQAERLAVLSHRMAERFARGGRLLAVGWSPAARSDVRHVAVEFVHPVIVGKRALPAIGLGREGGPLLAQVALTAEPDDMAIGFGVEAGCEETASALAAAARRGCMTIGFAPGCAEWDIVVPHADAGLRQELVEQLYHLLWEHVHVFFEHKGLLAGRTGQRAHDSGASSFLYPFLAEQETDLDGVLADVRASIALKAAEMDALRAQTLGEGEAALAAAAEELRARLGAGGRVLLCGNGGSATDAMDAAADLRTPPPGSGWTARPAIDLTEDAAILTALANDIGVEGIFARQVIAHGRATDVLIAFTTSGGSANVVAALAEARRRGLATLCFVGYDGGAILADGLADHVVVTRSEHIPRIQEAQAAAWHVLRDRLG